MIIIKNEKLEKVGGAANPAWVDSNYINAEVYKVKVLQEEENYKLWKKFIVELATDADNVKPGDWRQE